MFDKPMGNNPNQLNNHQPLGSANNSGINSKNSPVAPAPEVDVHAMPKKFLPQGPQSSGGSFGKTILIVIVALIIIGVAGAGIYWYMNRPQQPNLPDNNQNTVVNQNNNTNQPANANQNVNANGNDNQNTNTNDVDVNLNLNTNINTNTNTNTDNNNDNSVDTDNDGLTYNEELTFGTSPNNDDTDHDGYKDGAEVKSLYSPLLPSQKLIDSGLVTNFVNDIFGYSVFRPTAWLSQSLSDDLGTVTILPDSESGEFFTIVARANTKKLTLTQAKGEVADILPANIGLVNYTLAKKPALRSTDQTKVLMVTEDYIYVIIHNIGLVGTNSLSATFDMMLNSFRLSGTVKTPQTNG